MADSGQHIGSNAMSRGLRRYATYCERNCKKVCDVAQICLGAMRFMVVGARLMDDRGGRNPADAELTISLIAP